MWSLFHLNDQNPQSIYCSCVPAIWLGCPKNLVCQATISEYQSQTLLQVSILIETVCRFFPAYYNWIYMLTPNYWRFRRACQTVHKFSLEVIRKRRADLEEQKVGHTHSEIQRSGSDFIGLVCSLPVRGREKMCWMEESENTLILLTCYWKQRYVFWTSFVFRLHARESSQARPNKGDWHQIRMTEGWSWLASI